MMKDTKPLVVINCLTFNHEPYIRECLEGFVMQKTNFKFVAIVHDDASTDGTAAIIREYAEKFPEIICPIFEKENQYSKKDGSIQRIMSDAINATGAKYVAMCEGDDYWIDPYKLQKQVDFMEANPDYSICFHKVMTLIHQTGEMKDEYIVEDMPGKSIISDLSKGNYIHTPSVLYRRHISLQEKYARMMPCLPGDYVLWMLLAETGDIYKFDEAMAVYRVGSGLWSTNHTIKNDLAYLCTLNKLDVSITNSQARKNIQKQINDITKLIMHIERDLNKIHCSKAYRLGKFLLRPFNLLKK